MGLQIYSKSKHKTKTFHLAYGKDARLPIPMEINALTIA